MTLISHNNLLLRYILRHLITLIVLTGYFFPAESKNRSMWWELNDSAMISDGKPVVTPQSLSNRNKKINIVFFLYPGNSPLEITKVEFEKRDTVFEPLEPIRPIYSNKGKDGKDIYWTIDIEFPFDSWFDEKDVLVLYTNKGTLRAPVSRLGRLLEEMSIIKEDNQELKQMIDKYETELKNYHSLRFICIGVFLALIITIVVSCVYFVRDSRINNSNRQKMSEKLRQLTEDHLNLENKINNMYFERLSPLNALYDEYYDKHESDSLRNSLHNEIENQLLSYKDNKKLAELETTVNQYQNNILLRIREQISDISKKDLVLLTYIYGGFSARAICILTNIDLKHFYYRRNKLKKQIQSTDASDKEEFLSKI